MDKSKNTVSGFVGFGFDDDGSVYALGYDTEAEALEDNEDHIGVHGLKSYYVVRVEAPAPESNRKVIANLVIPGGADDVTARLEISGGTL